MKPRGKPDPDLGQTFWTLEIQENEKDQYPRKVSFNSHEKDSGFVKLTWPIVNEAMTTGKPVTVFGYLSDNPQNEKAPYKNGTDIEWATEGGANGSAGPTSPAPTGTASPSAGSPTDDPWGDEPVAKVSPPRANSAPKATDWDERTYEIEAAWAAKAILDVDPHATADVLHKKALDLIILKRGIAAELKGWS